MVGYSLYMNYTLNAGLSIFFLLWRPKWAMFSPSRPGDSLASSAPFFKQFVETKASQTTRSANNQFTGTFSSFFKRHVYGWTTDKVVCDIVPQVGKKNPENYDTTKHARYIVGGGIERTPPLKPLCQIQWKSEPLRKLAAQIQPKDVDVMSAWNMNLEGCPFSVVEMVGRLPYIMVSVAMIPGKKNMIKPKLATKK